MRHNLTFIIILYKNHLLLTFCFFSLKAQVGESFENFYYNKVCLAVNHFVSNQLSAFYFHLVKDRLYCDAETSLARRSAVTTLWHILNAFRYFNKL